jgi:signal transduction histidine kinase
LGGTVVQGLAIITFLAAGKGRARRPGVPRRREAMSTVASPRWLVLATLLVPALLLGLVAWQDHVNDMRHARKDAMRTVAIFYHQASNVFAIDALAAALVDEKIRGMGWDEIGHSATLQKGLAAIVSRYPQISSLRLVDPNGFVRSSSTGLPTAPISTAGCDFFKALQERDSGIYISRPAVGHTHGSRHFNIALRRTSATGAFDGIIVVSVRSTYLTDFWKRTAPKLDVAAKLFRSDGTILAREPLPNAEMLLAANNPLLRAVGRSASGSLTAVSGVDGVERFYFHKKIDSFPVYLAYGIGVEAVARRSQQHLVVYGGVFGSAAIVLVLMALAFSRSARREAEALQHGRLVRSRLNAETARRSAAEEQLYQSQKMDALGQMIGGVAHDFGNILTIIVLNLELLDQRVVEPGCRKLVDNALTGAERAEKAIAALLGFARNQPLRSEIFDANMALRNMVPLLQQALRSDISLEMSLAPGVLTIEADPNRTALAVLNLVVNARDAMPERGVLQIRTRKVTLKGTVDGLVGDFAMLTVTDTGTGIAPDLLSRVFEPFYTTKGSQRGTGLGLSMVNSFAKQSRGAVAIESVVGQGTTITLYLPCAAPTGDDGVENRAMPRHAVEAPVES